MRAHNPSLLSEVVLYVLYQQAITTGHRLSVGNIRAQLQTELKKSETPGAITDVLVSFAIRSLIDRDYLTSQRDKDRINVFVISRRGYDYVRQRLEMPGSAIEQYSQSAAWLFQAEKQGDDAPVAEENSRTSEQSGDEHLKDDSWEPLPLERSGELFEQAADSTEKALAEIKGNNGYAESEPEERERIVWSLSEAVRQMREGMPSRDQILVMAVRPLKYIAEKFARASMGEVAKAAVKAIWAWLQRVGESSSEI